MAMNTSFQSGEGLRSGMMGLEPPPQAPGQPPPPPQGQPMQPGQPPQQQGFNGVVDVQGQPVKVVNGMAQFQGKPYFVSPPVSVVLDQNKRIVGKVENGKLSPMNPKHVDAIHKAVGQG